MYYFSLYVNVFEGEAWKYFVMNPVLQEINCWMPNNRYLLMRQ